MKKVSNPGSRFRFPLIIPFPSPAGTVPERINRGDCAGELGQRLEYNSNWADAAEWHAIDVTHQIRAQESTKLCRALERLGHCREQLGDFLAAATAHVAQLEAAGTDVREQAKALYRLASVHAAQALALRTAADEMASESEREQCAQIMAQRRAEAVRNGAISLFEEAQRRAHTCGDRVTEAKALVELSEQRQEGGELPAAIAGQRLAYKLMADVLKKKDGGGGGEARREEARRILAWALYKYSETLRNAHHASEGNLVVAVTTADGRVNSSHRQLLPIKSAAHFAREATAAYEVLTPTSLRDVWDAHGLLVSALAHAGEFGAAATERAAQLKRAKAALAAGAIGEEERDEAAGSRRELIAKAQRLDALRAELVAATDVLSMHAVRSAGDTPSDELVRAVEAVLALCAREESFTAFDAPRKALRKALRALRLDCTILDRPKNLAENNFSKEGKSFHFLKNSCETYPNLPKVVTFPPRRG